MTGQFGETQNAQIVRRTPLGRMGKPSGVVGLVWFLTSDEAGFTTGQSIVVDEGVTC